MKTLTRPPLERPPLERPASSRSAPPELPAPPKSGGRPLFKPGQPLPARAPSKVPPPAPPPLPSRAPLPPRAPQVEEINAVLEDDDSVEEVVPTPPSLGQRLGTFGVVLLALLAGAVAWLLSSFIPTVKWW